ncbi:MAG: methyltransferase domain-containing protein [Phycisphaera sp.]|nr:methyltransferase domain-containing protein [Phycisphaera sp.]
MNLRERIKWWLFPGINLHARLRWRELPRRFGTANGAPRTVLDAGCGNGMLAYQAYLRGSRVIGISIKRGEVDRNRRLFNEALGIDDGRLSFRLMNLYNLGQLEAGPFDEIICTEVLEHIADDAAVCRSFYDALKPGGVLHVTSPNADHPDNRAHDLDTDEAGGHVRSGYTDATFRALLEPLGFRVDEIAGLGGPMRQRINRAITATQQRLGVPAGVLLYMATWPVQHIDAASPAVPYCLYARATKPA